MRKLLTILLLFCFFSLRAQYPEFMPEFKVMNTKADIKNHLAINGSVVLLRGLDTLNDGAGGWYEFNSTSIATPNDTTVFQVTGVITGRWLRMLVGGGSQVTIEGDTIIINNIKIRNVLKIPLTDTTHAKKGCANMIYDTILEHFYGDVCLNGVHSAWSCFDCASTGTVFSVATNDGTGIKGGTITTSGTLRIDTSIVSTKANVDSKTITLIPGTNVSIAQVKTQNLGQNPSWTIVSDDSDAFHTTFQLNDSTYVIRRPNGTADTIVISGIATGGGGGGIGTITEIRATNNFAQTWTITNPTGAITTLSLVLDTTLYSTRLWRQKGIDSVAAKLVANYTKNATRDSTILTLNDGTRYAAKDSVGAQGTLSHVYAPLITSGDTISQRYNILHYGALRATITHDAAITSGAATLTSATAAFVLGDVGKYVVVKRAGTSGRDLVTTIAGFTNSTTVTLTATASSTVTSATLTFGIDCTVPIQNAINAANSAGGGTVWCPIGVYLIAGALQTSIGGLNMNSQLYIPNTDLNIATRNHIEIQGEAPINLTPAGTGLSGSSTAMPISSGAIFYSILTSGASGCAVIGTNGNTQTWGNYNYTYLTVQNLGIEVLNNPAGLGPEIGGINYKFGASILCKDVSVFIDTAGFYSTLPQNTLAGIESSNNASEAFNSIQNTVCMGFRNGYILGEHVSLNHAEAWTCFNGFNLKSGGHFSVGVKMTAQWCANDVYVSAAANLSNWTIIALDVEWQQIGKWYDDVFTIKDTANHANMTVYYCMIVAGSGIDQSKFTISGGTNISYYSFYEPLFRLTAASNNVTGNTGWNVVSPSTKIDISTATANDGIKVTQSSTANTAEVAVFNAGFGAYLKSYGSTFGVTSLQSKQAVAADLNLLLISSGQVANAGTGSIAFRPGGYDVTAETMRLNAAGNLGLMGTNTGAGTTGAQTINKPTGSVNFAIGATSLVVTNSLVTTGSLIFCTIQKNDATFTSCQVVAGTGSFTIYANAAATAETKVAFWVMNNF